MNPDSLQRFVALRRYFTVVHHLPGRIRLRVDAGFLAAAGQAERAAVTQLLEAVDGIDAVRVNALAASVVVQYDTHRLAPAHWETLLNGSDQAAAALLQQLVRQTD